jgi:hypothetical protein
MGKTGRQRRHCGKTPQNAQVWKRHDGNLVLRTEFLALVTAALPTQTARELRHAYLWVGKTRPSITTGTYFADHDPLCTLNDGNAVGRLGAPQPHACESA